MFFIFRYTLLFITISIFSVIKPVNCEIDWPTEFEVTQNFSQALVEIVNTLYIDEIRLNIFNFHVKVLDENRKYLPEFEKIIEETMQLLNDNITIYLKNSITISTDRERHYCILLVDSGKSLEFLYQDLNKYHLFVQGSYYIVLLTFPHVLHYYDELFEIFQINWRNGIIHADVLIHAVQNVILLFHSVPFTQFHCRGVAPIVHNKFINGNWLHKNFFIEKTKNLFGCPLICATWEDWPYYKLLKSGPPKNKITHFGLEGQLLEYLSQKINFTIQIRWMSDEEIAQTLTDEKELFDSLFVNNTDFVIGAFHYKPTSLEDSYAPSNAYYMSDYYFVVSSKTDAYDPFVKLLLPFKKNLWFALIFIYGFGNIVVFIVIYLNRKLKALVLGRVNETPGYNMVVISLGGAVAKDPKVPFSRFLLMLWLLTTFVLRTVYQGFMYHFIKTDLRNPPPKLISDLFTNEYRILMTDVVYNSIMDIPLLYAKAELLNTSEHQAFEMIKRSKDFEPYKLAILTAHEYFGYYKYVTPINYDFYVVPDKLFTQQLCIYMKKNSPFLRRFNLNIDTYTNEGLMSRWERNLVYNGESRRPTDDSPKPTKIAHVFAAFLLLLIGLSGSLMAFVVELCLFYGKILLRPSKKKRQRML